MERTSTATSRSESKTEIRRWIRSDEPNEGWWPWGILPLVGLLALALIAFLYVAPRNVEAETASDARARLDAAGMKWAQVNADGQELRVTGTAPFPVTDELRNQVAAAATVGNCELFGCRVLVDIEGRASAPIEAIAAPKSERFHDFAFEAKGDEITLSGEVESQEAKREIAAVARRHFESVDDQLSVSTEEATYGYALAYPRALAILAMLESGKATWQAGRLDVNGLVTAANDAPARAAFAAADASPRLGDIKLVAKETADRCDEEFAAAFSESTINFQTGSAVIAASSQALLTKLAETARECPGRIAIEGHTDADGKEASNVTLSQQRAEAVAKALASLGVESARLSPTGFGESKPIAPNATAAGKAKNRRIEMRVIR